MTDAELQAALSAGTGTTPATTPTPPGTFNVFVDAAGNAAPLVPTAPAPAAAAPAAPIADPNAALVQQLMQNQQALMLQMQQMQQANAELMTRQTPATPAPPPAVFSLDGVLDANDQEIYKDFLPLLTKVTQAQARFHQEHHVAPLVERVAALTQETQEARARAAGATDASFTAALYARIPNLPQVVNTPEWRAFLKSPAPFSGGRTVEQQVVAAYQASDVGTINDYYAEFERRRATPGAPPAVPAAGQAAVQHVPAPQVPGAGGAQPRLISQARLDAALAAAQSGRMTREAYDKLMDDMLSAGLEGAQLVN